MRKTLTLLALAIVIACVAGYFLGMQRAKADAQASEAAPSAPAAGPDVYEAPANVPSASADSVMAVA